MSELPDVWYDAGHGVHVGVPRGHPVMDSEGKFVWEPYGWPFFAWWPRWCRNGKVRWLTTLERHDDGTYTKSSLR